jgi:hypothetical protein
MKIDLVQWICRRLGGGGGGAAAAKARTAASSVGAASGRRTLGGAPCALAALRLGQQQRRMGPHSSIMEEGPGEASLKAMDRSGCHI